MRQQVPISHANIFELMKSSEFSCALEYNPTLFFLRELTVSSYSWPFLTWGEEVVLFLIHVGLTLVSIRS